MADSGFWKPVVGDLCDTRPRHNILLATSPKRATPKGSDVVAKCTQSPSIRGHRVVRKEARDHLLEPSPLFGDGFMHALSQLHLDLPKLRPHAVPASLPLKLESTPAGLTTDKGAAQEGECLRSPRSRRFTAA
jgi:hypothetical protein